MDIQNIDIAHYTGHKAIEELAMARWLYLVPIADALAAEGIQVTSLDFKHNHDIEDLKRIIRVVDLELSSVDAVNAFHWSGFLESLRKKEGEHCINAAIFFQAMMEAVINDQLGGRAEGRSFAQKWKSFLDENAAPEGIKQAFERYVEQVYRKIRIRAVHAKSRVGGLDQNSLRFPFVHAFLRSGWDCFVFLTGVAHGFQIDYDDNWKTMCDIHDLPATVDENDFPDMGELSGMMIKVHMDFFNRDSK